MKTCVLYARSALVGQVGESGVQSQIKELRAYAQNQGYQITKEYVDIGKSGSNLLRPKFTQLRKDIEQGKVKTILVTHPTRLSRNMLDFTLLADLFRKPNVTVEYTQIPSSSLVQSILVAISEFESNILRERVKAALQTKRSKQIEKTPSLAAQRSFQK